MDFFGQLGKATARRSITRNKETWADVADRVAFGNSLLGPMPSQANEYKKLKQHMTSGAIVMSGRHLQHGDETQLLRPIEVFTNCSTAPTSFLLYLLLLNGSGVGRCYDDDMMLVNWKNLPNFRCTISPNHPDAPNTTAETDSFGTHYDFYHTVKDTREGLAKIVELLEVAAFEGTHANEVWEIDFSDIRPKGAPIKGMQGRPASGPQPLIEALQNIALIKHMEWPRWKQAMYVDHYLAESVLVGGARRAARMATKQWTDPGIFQFIDIKREGDLWSSNNSVTVDTKFWNLVNDSNSTTWWHDKKHAYDVFKLVCEAAYFDGTGEPGFINVDQLQFKAPENINAKKLLNANHPYQADCDHYLSDIVTNWRKKPYKSITNPCGEIILSSLGAYCVIGDIIPAHTKSLQEFEDAARTATRALIRTNTMPALYEFETKRTNRIGVSLTGIHEYAAQMGLSFSDLLDERLSQHFWRNLAYVARAIDDEAERYSAMLGVVTPHTTRTIKPAGTTSKLFGLSEGAHLPAMSHYLRWVQFTNGSPQIEEYRKRGYPVRELKTYKNHTIVGFPTKLRISELHNNPTHADEVSMEQQFKWLQLLEKYWINAGDKRSTGNQISYTLKYDPTTVSFHDYQHYMKRFMPTVRCCAVMPKTDDSAYEYLPEQAITLHEYHDLIAAIDNTIDEDIGREHLDCANGACPIDYRESA